MLALAAVVYTPLLLTAPGTVIADTKTYLYLDPGQQIRRALSMWDPHIALGTVPHQQIGYLWPMGPYYWVMEQVGMPDWAAQRIWLGSIMVAAGGGVLFLCRTWRWRPTAATAAAFVYALSPYVLTLATRLSAILLPFAGLPWLLALTIRSLRTKGWRHPALFGLTVATIGSVNATALLLVGLVPVGWIFYSVLVSHEVGRPRAVSTMAKIGVVSIAVNLWWIIGLSVQATNGINVLQYSETAKVVSTTSTAPEVLRGLGYWFAYGSDRLYPWVEPAIAYTQNLWLIAVTFAIPVVGLLGLGISRWRHRAFVVGLLVVGLVLAVGAYPFGAPPPVGAVIKLFLETDTGLAMRSLARAVPLVALAMALGIGSVVGAVAEQVPRRGLLAAIGVAVIAYAALPPLWTGGLAPEGLSRPEALPQYWQDAADYLDSRDDGTRVLEMPGIDFASYRWGTTIDPVTPGLMERPYVARELVPYGSPASADVLRALDLQLQEGTLDPAAIAPIARLLGVGDIVLRNDLQYERHFIARPRSVMNLVESAVGLGSPVAFGPSTPNVPSPKAPLVDETHLARDENLPDPPAVAVFPVRDPVPIVTARSADSTVLLSGDGDGLVDAAGAGVLSGDELIRYSSEVTDDPDFVRTQLTGDRQLVVTDTNRKRGERWTQLRYIAGYTETVGGGLLADDLLDNRLPVQDDRPGTQTVAVQRGLTVRATSYGTPIGYYTESRPALAADGDETTAWRTAAFDDAVGERIELTTPEPVRTDHVTLLQPAGEELNRSITEVELRFDGNDPMKVALDQRSRQSPGQRIDIGDRTFSTLSVKILADTAGRRPNYGGLTAEGFAEIDIAGHHVDEIIQMPSDLLDAAGYRSGRYPLSLLQTRIRLAATDAERKDEEQSIRRLVDLPTARTFRLTGTARLSPDAPAALLDQLIGRTEPTAGQATVTADSYLPGGFMHIPSNVLDGDPTTWWTTRFGVPEQSVLQVTATAPVTTDHLGLTWVDDAEHSVPASVDVLADGTPVGTLPVAPVSSDGDLRSATLSLPAPVTATTFEIRFSGVAKRDTVNWYGGRPLTLPMAIAEVDVAGLQVPAVDPQIDTGCRDDLLAVDGDAVPVRISGPTSVALDGRGLTVQGCQTVELSGGTHEFDATTGAATGLDLDQLLWRSDPVATSVATATARPSDTASATAPTVEVVDDGDTRIDLTVRGAQPDHPFWLVLGESYNSGWQLVSDDAADADGPQLVNGYANGYLVDPAARDFDLSLRFVPQNRVDVAFLVSIVGVIGAVLLALFSTGRSRPAEIPRQEPLRRIRALTYEGALPGRREAVVVGAIGGVLGLALANPLIAVALAVVGGFATRREGWRPLLTVLPAVLLAAVGGYVVLLQGRRHLPSADLGWPGETARLHVVAIGAVLLLVLDAVIHAVWRRGSHLD